MAQPSKEEMVMSYYRVRTALGILGLILPALLILGGYLSSSAIQPSISDYYHTLLRDFFVGVMFAIGVFLISYKGYPRSAGEVLSDDWVATLAGIAAFFVALFPNETGQQGFSSPLHPLLGINGVAVIHYFSATVFLLCLSYLCLFKFRKTAKPWRRRIYGACGWVILIGWVGVFIASFLKVKGGPAQQDFVIDNNIVLWCEAVAVWAFAISWLVKGRAEQMIGLGREKPAR